MENSILKIKNFNAFFGDNRILKNINLDIEQGKVWTILGPSGCGKTTLIRCINRMHEMAPGAHSSGTIFLGEENIFGINPVLLRRKIGMVFQRPNPFPTMSIYHNVLAGYSLNGIKLSKNMRDEIVETSLKGAALWDEVKDKLTQKGTFLSGGQQQRLCIARTLAMKPEVLLLDEATSALDPVSTAKIEELIYQLKNDYTILMVTHNMQQAARVSDKTAFLFLGELIEYNDTKDIFTNPRHKKTQDYITGRFG